MSMKQIPNELLPLIINHISNEFVDLSFHSDMARASRISSRWTILARERLYEHIYFDDDTSAVSWIESECTQRMEFYSESLTLGEAVSPGIAGEIIDTLKSDEKLGGIKELIISMTQTFDARNLRSEKLRDMTILELEGSVGPSTKIGANLTNSFSFQLDEIRFGVDVEISTEFLSHILSPSLKKLRTTLIGEDELFLDTIFTRLHLVPNLTHCSFYNCSDLDPTQISHLTSLKSIAIATNS